MMFQNYNHLISVISYINSDSINSEILDINNTLHFNNESFLYFNANSMREEVIINNSQNFLILCIRKL